MIRNIKYSVAFYRRFSSSSISYSEHFMKTTLNPKLIRLDPPKNINPKSVLLLSTPSLLPLVIQESIRLFEQDKLQVCVAGVDAMVPNSMRNGLSEIWMDEYMEINESLQLDDEKDDLEKDPKESDGINIVSARKNWKIVDSNLKITFNSSHVVDINLANTAFSTDHLVTLFYFLPLETSDKNMGTTLSSLSLTLPKGIVSDNTEIFQQDNWTPLATSEELRVTDSIGNLLKSINNQPASNYLQNNKELMDIASKDTQVFVKVYNEESVLTRKYEVIAGGGSWGTKASILALSPEAKVKKGEKIEFYMLTPTDRFTQKLSLLQKYDGNNTISFESCYEPRSYQSNVAEEEIVMCNVFGCGSDKGFMYNKINYCSAGENLIMAS